MSSFSSFSTSDDGSSTVLNGGRGTRALRILLGAMILVTGVLMIRLLLADVPPASQLELVTEPPGAMVLIDGGELEFTTPMKVSLRPRRYEFKIAKEGFEAVEFLMDVPAGADPKRKVLKLVAKAN